MKHHIARVVIGIVLPLLVSAGAFAADWKRITNPPAVAGTMVLLTNGEVMTLTSSGYQVWMRLSPDAKGDYSNGSWRLTTPMSIPRLYFGSNVVRDTRLIVIGGEYSGNPLQANHTNTGEAYNPATDSWSAIAPPAPYEAQWPAPRAISLVLPTSAPT